MQRFHDPAAAEQAQQAFIQQFSAGAVPEDIAEFDCAKLTDLRLGNLCVAAGLCASQSEARRLIEQRAVRVDSAVVEDLAQALKPPFNVVVRVGKRRYARLLHEAVE